MASTRRRPPRSRLALPIVFALLVYPASLAGPGGHGLRGASSSSAGDPPAHVGESAGPADPAPAAPAPAGDDAVPAPADLPYRTWFLEIAHDGPPPPRPAPALPLPPEPVAPAPPTPARPSSPAGHTLWSDGDSVSYFMTTNLLAILSDYGATPVRAADYKISSRLTWPSGHSAVLGVPFSDWFSYMTDELSRFDPDVVVFMVGANDAGFADPGTFGEDAARMMDLLRRDGRVVAWVGLPAFIREDLARSAPPLNEAARAAAESRSWVVFVDTSHISPDAADGVHFGPGRARQLAEAVIAALFPGLGAN